MEYKITKVSEQEPRSWQGPNGTINYYKVMVEGHSKPIELGKKAGNVPSVGDVLFGSIEETTYPTDKFKRGNKPFGSQGSFKAAGGYSKDEEGIKAMWAIKTAVQALNGSDVDSIEKLAKELFDMVERVKGGSATPEPAKDTLPAFDAIKEDEQVDLSEIPF